MRNEVVCLLIVFISIPRKSKMWDLRCMTWPFTNFDAVDEVKNICADHELSGGPVPHLKIGVAQIPFIPGNFFVLNGDFYTEKLSVLKVETEYFHSLVNIYKSKLFTVKYSFLASIAASFWSNKRLKNALNAAFEILWNIWVAPFFFETTNIVLVYWSVAVIVDSEHGEDGNI